MRVPEHTAGMSSFFLNETVVCVKRILSHHRVSRGNVMKIPEKARVCDAWGRLNDSTRECADRYPYRVRDARINIGSPRSNRMPDTRGRASIRREKRHEEAMKSLEEGG